MPGVGSAAARAAGRLGDDAGEAELLASCYRRAIELAAQSDCRTVAFPAISAGIYGWPMDSATQIAVDTVLAADTNVETVVFVPFSADAEEAFQAALAASKA